MTISPLTILRWRSHSGEVGSLRRQSQGMAADQKQQRPPFSVSEAQDFPNEVARPAWRVIGHSAYVVPIGPYVYPTDARLRPARDVLDPYWQGSPSVRRAASGKHRITHMVDAQDVKSGVPIERALPGRVALVGRDDRQLVLVEEARIACRAD
jgi:hypothetical protein